MLNKLKKILNKQQFEPSIIGVFLNPFYITRNKLFKFIRLFAKDCDNDTVLDIGCGTTPYRKYFDTKNYFGLDIKGGGHSDDQKTSDVYYNGFSMPFKNSSFDSILTTQVIEHTMDPTFFISEINRVLKKGGKLFISSPFCWPEHEVPFDFWRYSTFGIRKILEEHGFQIISVNKCEHFLESMAQLLSIYVYTKTLSQNKYFTLLVSVTVCSFIQILGIIMSWALPNNKDFYLCSVVLAKKI